MLLIITGPTASGKTYIAEKVARKAGGEIISADSRTIYRNFDIGTGKFTNSGDLPYHMINMIDPGKHFSSYEWVRRSRMVIEDIGMRDRTPIICGGTMHYIHMFINGIDSVPGPDEGLRRSLREKAKKEGKEQVHKTLEALDPELAASVHPNNLERVIRYIEKLQGKESVEALDPFEGPFSLFFIEPDRELLRSRIRFRVNEMLKNGWVEEVEKAMTIGHDIGTPGFDSIGYREIFDLINGDINMEEAEDSIFSRTIEFSKKQMNWKKRFDPHTIKIDHPSDLECAVDIMMESLHMNCRSRQYAV